MAWQDLNSFQHSGNSFADNQATSPIFVQLILESDPVWLTDSFIIAQKERKEEEKYVLMERNMSGAKLGTGRKPKGMDIRGLWFETVEVWEMRSRYLNAG